MYNWSSSHCLYPRELNHNSKYAHMFPSIFAMFWYFVCEYIYILFRTPEMEIGYAHSSFTFFVMHDINKSMA